VIVRTDRRFSICSFCLVFLKLLHHVSNEIPAFLRSRRMLWAPRFRSRLQTRNRALLPAIIGSPSIILSSSRGDRSGEAVATDGGEQESPIICLTECGRLRTTLIELGQLHDCAATNHHVAIVTPGVPSIERHCVSRIWRVFMRQLFPPRSANTLRELFRDTR